MKIIKNSIDSEYLQDSISDADLEKEMAQCEMKSEMLKGGHQTDKIKNSDKTNMERVEVKLSNGIHGKAESPTKYNGKVNGFCEEEEDINLFLEDSSEGGESPSKKIDDDNISAPQIVQEIEDLLGINSSSAGIQEELNNLDGTESIEDTLDNVEDIEEMPEVFEEIDENKVEECKSMDGEKVEKTDEVKKLPNKQKEVNECDTSSHMDLVFDEVEVGMENGDVSTSNESNSVTKLVDAECKVGSTTEAKHEKVKHFVMVETKDTTSREDDTQGKSSEKNHFSVQNTRDEIPNTQSSNDSGNSEEWVVLDTVETSDEEKLESSQDLSDCVEDLIINDSPPPKSSETVDDITTETDCSHSLPVGNKTVENLPLENSSEIKNFKSDADCTLSIPDDNVTVEHLAEENDTSEKTSRIPCEGDGMRKRCASVEKGEEEVELKKPKLDGQNCFVESSSPVLKRLSSATPENESKRSKLSETKEECRTLNDRDCKVSKKPEKIIDEIESEPDKKNDSTNIPIKSTLKEKPLLKEESLNKTLLTDKISDKSHTIASNHSIPLGLDDVLSTVKPREKLISDLAHGNKIASVFSKEASTSGGGSRNSLTEEHSPITTSETQLSEGEVSDGKMLGCEESERESEGKLQNCGLLEEKSVCDEKNENVSITSMETSKEEVGFKLDDLSSVTNKELPKPDKAKQVNGLSTKTDSKIIEFSKHATFSKELSTSIKELEKSLIKSGVDQIQGDKDLKDTESKKMTNLDFAIERVVEKARIQTEKKVPILKKFHKDQLKKLKRSELEDIVVSKICEAVTYKSEIGQMRLRTQNLEETNEMWRKKVTQIEKQNRELEMVLKRFLAELAHIKRENQNKVPMPIKVTRSVGLQVVLASTMHGALVSSRSKINNESTQQQQQAKAKQLEKEKEKVKEPIKATTFMPPSQSAIGRGRGRPPKAPTTQTSRPSTPQTLPPKVTPPTTPSKPTSITPVKTIQTQNKDLEVIDLTDREEKAKSIAQPPVSGSIRVAPSTQVCFVQQGATPSPPQQQPLYLVQKAGQRPQFLVATSSASPQRPISNVSRPPPALALPVLRAGNHLITMQTSPQVGVKTNTTTTPSAVARQVSTALRIQQQTLKHPAPLPSAPTTASKPGMKAPPPKPQLKIAKTSNGIMLSWSMSLNKDMADMQSYQLYAYQEGNQPPSTGLWKKVGDVKALPLPMACTLTQFIEGHKYHFAVRAVDAHGRIGPFSTPSSILLTK